MTKDFLQHIKPCCYSLLLNTKYFTHVSQTGVRIINDPNQYGCNELCYHGNQTARSNADQGINPNLGAFLIINKESDFELRIYCLVKYSDSVWVPFLLLYYRVF